MIRQVRQLAHLALESLNILRRHRKLQKGADNRLPRQLLVFHQLLEIELECSFAFLDEGRAHMSKVHLLGKLRKTGLVDSELAEVLLEMLVESIKL